MPLFTLHLEKLCLFWKRAESELHVNLLCVWLSFNCCGWVITEILSNISNIHNSVFQGILPRGKSPNRLRERNSKVNKLVQEAVSSLPHASFFNVDPGFVHSNGSISHQDMYDYLHLTPQGYQAVCEPLHAHLKSMLDKPAENWATMALTLPQWSSSLSPESISLSLLTPWIMDRINLRAKSCSHYLCKSSSWPGLVTTVTDNGTIKSFVFMIQSEIKCAVLERDKVLPQFPVSIRSTSLWLLHWII